MYLADIEKFFDVTSIHSHPFLIENNNYSPASASKKDKNSFPSYNLNIIVGYLTAPNNITEAYPYSSENIGAAFYTPSSGKTTTLSIRAITRIVRNQYTISHKHFDSITKDYDSK